jgi:hypothetical protein
MSFASLSYADTFKVYTGREKTEERAYLEEGAEVSVSLAEELRGQKKVITFYYWDSTFTSKVFKDGIFDVSKFKEYDYSKRPKKEHTHVFGINHVMNGYDIETAGGDEKSYRYVAIVLTDDYVRDDTKISEENVKIYNIVSKSSYDKDKGIDIEYVSPSNKKKNVSITPDIKIFYEGSYRNYYEDRITLVERETEEVVDMLDMKKKSEDGEYYLYKKVFLKPNTEYLLTIDNSALETSYGRGNEKKEIRFTTVNTEHYALDIDVVKGEGLNRTITITYNKPLVGDYDLKKIESAIKKTRDLKYNSIVATDKNVVMEVETKPTTKYVFTITEGLLINEDLKLINKDITAEYVEGEFEGTRPTITPKFDPNNIDVTGELRFTASENMKGYSSSLIYLRDAEGNKMKFSRKKDYKTNEIVIYNFDLEYNKDYVLEFAEGALYDEKKNKSSKVIYNLRSVDSVSLTDISGHWAKDSIKRMSDKKIVNGYNDNTFKPDKSISREEFSKLVATAFEINPKKISKGRETFKDLKHDWWSTGYVEAIKDYYKYDKKDEDPENFNPSEAATREVVADVLIKVLKYDKDPLNILELEAAFADYKKMEPKYRNNIYRAYKRGLIKGYEDGTFLPKKALTRAEIVVLLERALNNKE